MLRCSDLIIYYLFIAFRLSFAQNLFAFCLIVRNVIPHSPFVRGTASVNERYLISESYLIGSLAYVRIKAADQLHQTLGIQGRIAHIIISRLQLQVAVVAKYGSA